MNEWDVKSFEFPLTADSVVIELGGFNGRWCGEIARRYNPRLFVYEPQAWAYQRLIELLSKYNAQVFPYGLGTQTASNLVMGEFGTDGCSFLPAGRAQGLGDMREWYAEMAERGIGDVDVLLMNIEGYEFELLPYILPFMPRFKWFMVQYHVPKAEGAERTLRLRQYNDTRAQLAETHALAWDYGATLSCWERKP